MRVPDVVFKEKIGPDWDEWSTEDIFKNQRSVIVSLPGAFTPVCSSQQVPEYDAAADQFFDLGIDSIYILSVNDWFVMDAWMKELKVNALEFIADGSGEFTKQMNMLVWKPLQNFGWRSWRYAMIVNDMKIEKMFVEEGKNCRSQDDDPHVVSRCENVLAYLKSQA